MKKTLLVAVLALIMIIFMSCSEGQHEYIMKSTENIKQGEVFYFPLEINVKTESNIYEKYDVYWEQSDFSSMEIGKFEFTGKIKKTSKEMLITIIVDPKIVGYEELNLIVDRGAELFLPERIKAKLVDGTFMEFDVVWDEIDCDLEKVKSFEVHGTVLESDIQPFAAVSVIDYILYINDISLCAFQKEKVSLPEKILVNLSDGSEELREVIWTQSILDTNSIGEKRIEGTVLEYEYPVVCIVKVYPEYKDIMVKEYRFKQNSEEKLPDEIEILYGDGSSGFFKVFWEDSLLDLAIPGEYTVAGELTEFAKQIEINVVVTKLIVSIERVKLEFIHMQDAELPESVKVVYNDGSLGYVAVNWSKQLDTNKTGSFTITGSIEGYDNEVICEINVKPYIVHIEDLELVVKKGDNQKLPSNVTVKMSDSSIEKRSVSWKPGKLDTSKPGTYYFSGVVSGYDGKVALKVTVANQSNLSNERIAWYFIANTSHTTPKVNTAINLSEYGAFYTGNTNSKIIYLTFDLGYENGYTSSVLDILASKNVKATFMLTKGYIDSNSSLTKRIANEGHDAGNHTVTHSSMPTIAVSESEIKDELDKTNAAYKKITGKNMLKIVRPPYGDYSALSLYRTKQAGYRTVFWSFAYKDYDLASQPDPQDSLTRIIATSHKGEIILLHVAKTNATILGELIDKLKEMGYSFRTLGDI